MNDVQSFVVNSQQAGQTLLAVMRACLPGMSWSACRRLLTGRRVTVSGIVCVHEARRLQAGDKIGIAGAAIRPAASAGQLLLHYVDDDLVVVDKPAGVVCTRHVEEQGWSAEKKRLVPTLDELVAARLQASLPRGLLAQKSPSRLLRVQRLDRDTTGVMVFARTTAAASGLIEQFAGHQAERIYHALVHGRVTEGTIRSHLVRDRGVGRRGSSPDGRHGVPAVTHVRPLEQRGAYSRIECRLETGRTHQIRIHLSEQGNPVCGDRRYGITDSAPRLTLHATFLAFMHPRTLQRMEFKSPWPGDLAAWWSVQG